RSTLRPRRPPAPPPARPRAPPAASRPAPGRTAAPASPGPGRSPPRSPPPPDPACPPAAPPARPSRSPAGWRREPRGRCHRRETPSAIKKTITHRQPSVRGAGNRDEDRSSGPDRRYSSVKLSMLKTAGVGLAAVALAATPVYRRKLKLTTRVLSQF